MYYILTFCHLNPIILAFTITEIAPFQECTASFLTNFSFSVQGKGSVTFFHYLSGRCTACTYFGKMAIRRALDWKSVQNIRYIESLHFACKNVHFILWRCGKAVHKL
jgi:hypothetical protein